MKKFLTLLAIIIFSTNAAAQTNWFTGTFIEAKNNAMQNNKLILLNLTAGTT